MMQANAKLICLFCNFGQYIYMKSESIRLPRDSFLVWVTCKNLLALPPHSFDIPEQVYDKAGIQCCNPSYWEAGIWGWLEDGSPPGGLLVSTLILWSMPIRPGREVPTPPLFGLEAKSLINGMTHHWNFQGPYKQKQKLSRWVIDAWD